MKPENDIEKKEYKRTGNLKEFLLLDDDNIAFVPVENIRTIERVIDNLEEIKQRLNKMRV